MSTSNGTTTDLGGGGRRGGAEEEILSDLGYDQSLKRSLTPFANFATSFSIVSIITGINQLYNYGLVTGGPAAIIWGWLLVAILTMFVALSMAEVCSAFPTTGGMYYSAAALAPANGKVFAWFCGWFNILGQFAITASISLGFSYFTGSFFQINGGLEVTPGVVIGLNAFVLVVCGVLNSYSVPLLNIMGTISVAWHILGTLVIFGILLGRAPTYQPASWVLGEFINETGWVNDGYVFLIGLLLAQWTFTGYDASSHMTEETKNASMAGPKGIIYTIIVSFVCGYMILFAMTFAIQDLGAITNTSVGLQVSKLYLDATGPQYASVIIFTVMGAMFFCCLSSVTANSRMVYAFARDKAFPFSKIWKWLSPKQRIPIPGVWLAVSVAFLLGLPSLGSSIAQAAVTSIATIGLYISYGIPIFLRLLKGDEFKPGPFNLGQFSRPVNVVACVWILFISVLFLLPPVYPVTAENFNYAPVAVGFVLLFAGGWWVVSARHWFEGPKALRKGKEGKEEDEEGTDDYNGT